MKRSAALLTLAMMIGLAWTREQVLTSHVAEARQDNELSIECHDASTSNSYSVSCESNMNGETATYEIRCTSTSSGSVHCSDSMMSHSDSTSSSNGSRPIYIPTTTGLSLPPVGEVMESDQSGPDQMFGGFGKTTVTDIALYAGTYEIAISAPADAPASVTLQDSTARVIFALTAQGPIEAARTMELADQGHYLLKISADGAWGIRIVKDESQ